MHRVIDAVSDPGVIQRLGSRLAVRHVDRILVVGACPTVQGRRCHGPVDIFEGGGQPRSVLAVLLYPTGEPGELVTTNRGLDSGHPVVVAHLNVPVATRSTAVGESPRTFCQVSVIGHDHPALTGHHIPDQIKWEFDCVADTPNHFIAMRLCRGLE